MKNIKEYLLEAIQNTYIFEMAYDRKELKKMVEGLFDQIIENWCLIKYCSLYDPTNTNSNHWRVELRSHIYNIHKMKLKGGNESTKSNLIKDIVYDKKEICTSKDISKIIRIKFRTEGLQIKSDICNECIEELPFIIELLASKETEENIDKIYDYIENL